VRQLHSGSRPSECAPGKVLAADFRDGWPTRLLGPVPKRLASHTTLGLGGPAAAWIEADSETTMLRAVESCSGERLILGGGSNLLVADKGFPGTVIKVRSTGVVTRRAGDGVILRAEAGHDWDRLVEQTIEEGLAGLECLSGIPGTVGAVPIQNVGAYGQCAKQTLVSVRAYDCVDGEIVSLPKADCDLSYRNSVFKQNPERYIVLAVEFMLEPGGLSKPIADESLAKHLGVPLGAVLPLGQVRDAVTEIRRGKGMVIDRIDPDPDSRSAGSFFLNPSFDAEFVAGLLEGYPPAADEDNGLPRRELEGGRVRISAAWLISHAGFERGDGYEDGIAISGKHILALVNRGSGSAAQAVSLAREIAERVWEKFEVELVPEPVFVGHSWSAGTG
jgi:UDP-N-acetylmuramate dehydrogenase